MAPARPEGGGAVGPGNAHAREERRAAQKLLMEVAKTLSRTALREKFLSQPAAAALLA